MYQWFGDVEDVVLLKDQLEEESSQKGSAQASKNGMLSSNNIPNAGSVMLAVPSTVNTIRRESGPGAVGAGGNGSGLIPLVVSTSIQRARSSTMPTGTSAQAPNVSLLGVKKVGAIDTNVTGQRTVPLLVASAAMSPTTEEEADDGSTMQSSTTVATSAGQLFVSTAVGGKLVTSVKAQAGVSDSDVAAEAASRLPASRGGTAGRRLDKQESSAKPLLESDKVSES
ncbi:hypothetical protein BCR44DRAFT_39593, partial [Catenaria anguillulae PL171]